jgi:hypothetical protein
MDMPQIDPKLLPYLIAGGGGALAGGALTAAGGERPGEGRWGRRWRVLRNALLLGGAGAGATALVNKGINDTVTAPLPANDQDPTSKTVHNIANNPWTRGGAAAGGAWSIGKQVGKEEQNAAYNSRYQIDRDSAQARAPKDLAGGGNKKDLRDTLARGISNNTPANPATTPDRSQAAAALDPSHYRAAGINRESIPVGSWKNNFGPAAKEEAIIAGQRLTGAGRGAGPVSKRLLTLGLSLGVPELISQLTKPPADQ